MITAVLQSGRQQTSRSRCLTLLVSVRRRDKQVGVDKNRQTTLTSSQAKSQPQNARQPKSISKNLVAGTDRSEEDASRYTYGKHTPKEYGML